MFLSEHTIPEQEFRIAGISLGYTVPDSNESGDGVEPVMDVGMSEDGDGAVGAG